MSSVVLVTGGAGYIGSHTCVELLLAGYECVVVDNLINSNEESLRRVEKITGKKILKFYKADLRDKEEMDKIFSSHPISAVIHFAGLKAVGESVDKPLLYYSNNIAGTLVLLDVMQRHKVSSLVFSSSATVYGDPRGQVPVKETLGPLSPTNPYGRTKLMVEDILRDLAVAEKHWRIAVLRYFNPVGAHISGMIGEDPRGIPNNLMPFVSQVAIGKRERLSVFGGDYDTPDGTGVRDYIHVVDLAKGHLAALKHLSHGCDVFNLGKGIGYSVLDVVKAFEKASGKPVQYAVGPRRAGDVATVFADCTKAADKLGWKADLGIDRMCEDAWRWQSSNPNGYA